MNLDVGPLNPDELEAADRIFRLAFGTRNAMADPIQFDGDAARLKTRFNSRNVSAIGARIGGELVGSNFITLWGSFCWIGPLSVRPDLWDKGIAQHLLGVTMDSVNRPGIKHVALFTVAESAKHVALYRKFGFWPGFLTLMMQRPTASMQTHPYVRFSQVRGTERTSCLDLCRQLTDGLYPGLDLSEEILSLCDLGLGDTLVLMNAGSVAGFAICHCGPGSEAATDTTYIKFAAATGSADFESLLNACQQFAASRGMRRLLAGVNTSRREAYGMMVSNGFRAIQQGVAMHRPDEPAYDRRGVYAIDDLR